MGKHTRNYYNQECSSSKDGSRFIGDNVVVSLCFGEVSREGPSHKNNDEGYTYYTMVRNRAMSREGTAQNEQYNIMAHNENSQEEEEL